MARKRKNENVADDDELDPDRLLDVKKIKGEVGVREVGNCGTIKSIYLKNFLCHSNLHFDFGEKQVNFVTGRNGSGKSAVLAGIVVGLGGKANTMNRGKSVRDYIKTNCNTAEISIVFCNEGVDAFMPSKCGKTITVERKLTASGTGGGYKMKNDKGAIVSDKYKDIVRMLDHFNIQLDNPVTVLSQDTSRQFLQSQKPTSLYEFFMRGTQLEEMKMDLDQIKQNMEQAKLVLDNRSAALPKIRDEVKKLSRLIQRHESLQTLRNQITLAYKELAWAKCYDQENVISQYVEGLEKMNEQLESCKTKTAALVNDIEKFEQETVDLTASTNDFQRRLEENKIALQNAERLFKSASNSVESKQREIDAIKSEIDEEIAQIKDLKKQIEEANDPNVELFTLKAEKQSTFEENTRKLNAKRQRLAFVTREIDGLESMVAKLTEKKSNLNAEKNALDYNFAKLNGTLSSLEASEKNQVEKFGKGTQQLLNLIKQAVVAGRFKREPRGPLGAHVKVLDSKWSLAVEVCLGPLCFAYVCDNFDDSHILEDLMKRCLERRPMIITSEFGNEEPYDVRRFTPNCQFPAVLSVLEIDDNVVRNVLIDQKTIESIILSEDAGEMRDFMYNSPPANVNLAYSSNGDQCFPKPNFRFYPSNKSNAFLLSGSTRENVDRLRKELQTLTESRKQVSSNVKACSAELNERESELSRLKNESNTLTNTIRQLEMSCNKLNREIDSMIIPENVDVALLQNEIDACKRKVETLENDSRKAKSDREALHRDCVEKRDERNRLKSILDGIYGEHEKERQKLSEIGENITKRQQTLNKINESVAKLEEKMNIWREKMNAENETLEQLQTEAKSVSYDPPVVAKRKAKTVEEEIDRLQKKLDVGEEEIGNLDQLMITYENKRSKLEKIEHDRTRLVKLLKIVTQSFDTRHEGFRLIRSMLSAHLSMAFMTRLRIRGFEGKLCISHNKETIEIKVVTHNRISNGFPDDDDTTTGAGSNRRSSSQIAARDLKGLSGGERSYSTVCFITSLWQLMAAPFRCLDEFDVFMDMVSRKLAMELILDCAQRYHSTGQFILLTPMDINSFVNDEHRKRVAIYRLSDPRDSVAIGRKNSAVNEDNENDQS